MTDIIAIVVILLIIGGAVAYIIKAKKSGKKCIGCPDGCSCGTKKTDQDEAQDSPCSSCSCCNGCHNNTENKQL